MPQLVFEINDNYAGLYDFIQSCQIDNILLVHGSHYTDFEIMNFINNLVLSKALRIIHFSDYTSNPKYEEVVKGVQLYSKFACEGIIAVGGGSTIDVAKCIKLFANLDEKRDYFEQKKELDKIPLIAIPTTAGSGSEATKHAVIYYKGEKQSISHESILPDCVVLDASVLKNLPAYQKKCTMLDALCQSLESWWSVHSNNQSVSYSKEAITLIRNNWKEYIEENSLWAAKCIMKASYLSGCAINITATTAAHAMSYKLTSLYGLPHGHAVAICMRQVWKNIISDKYRCNDARGKTYLEDVLRDMESLGNYEWFCALLDELQINAPKSEQKIADIEILVQAVNVERMSNNPVLFDQDTLRQMYNRIVGEK